MSNVYSLEPPTSGKVILKTNFGNIDIELFTKETPRTCRNFIQHCMISGELYSLEKSFLIKSVVLLKLILIKMMCIECLI